MITKSSTILATMLLASGMVFAQTPGAESNPKPQLQEAGKKVDGEWISYRNAYKTMIQFEKYGKPKHLIQNHFQIAVKSGQTLPDDLQLILQSKSMRLNLPVDALGRSNFPSLKVAYDENAELVLNQSPGPLVFQSRISIMTRADGVYDIADLRAACEQALAYLKTTGSAYVVGKSCSGVRFSYPKNLAQPGIRFRGSDMQLHALSIQENSAFPDESIKAYKTASLRFADWAEKGQLLTQQETPLAIALKSASPSDNKRP